MPLLAAMISAATLLAFSASINGAFVDWDDPRNFLNNLDYRGLAWTNIRWMLTSATMGHWIPVTWLTLGLDYVLWGMEPAGYHLTSIVLHAFNAALVFVVARRLLAAALGQATDRTLAVGAAAAAWFWALHPLRVESVAWVTERRDVVSGAFYLLTLLTYLVAAARSGAARAWWLGASLVAYALALTSKSIVMTLPVVLVVLDVYPLRRLPASWRAWRTAGARRVWLEKAPYAALAASGAATALIVVERSVPLTPSSILPYAARPLVLLYGVAFYAWKTVAPFRLSPLYELPQPLGSMGPALAAGAVTSLALTVVLLALRHRFPAGLAAWIAYVASSAPVGGLVHNGWQIAADRYTYLTGLGGSLLVGGLVTTLAGQRPGRARAAVVAVVLWLVALTALTERQIGVWRSSETLWAHAVAVSPNCVFCHYQLGTVLANRGALEPAIEQLGRAVALRPELVLYHVTLGRVLLRAGRPEEAARQFHVVIAEYPADVEALTNLGTALLASNRPADAAPVLERAVSASPSDALAQAELVRAYGALGRTRQAAQVATRLDRLEPARPARLPGAWYPGLPVPVREDVYPNAPLRLAAEAPAR